MKLYFTLKNFYLRTFSDWSFFQVHSHETVWSVKQKIASLLRVSADQLMLVIGDRPSPPGREQQSLSQLGCTDKQTWIVKSSSSSATISGGAQLTEVNSDIYIVAMQHLKNLFYFL